MFLRGDSSFLFKCNSFEMRVPREWVDQKELEEQKKDLGKSNIFTSYLGKESFTLKARGASLAEIKDPVIKLLRRILNKSDVIKIIKVCFKAYGVE